MPTSPFRGGYTAADVWYLASERGTLSLNLPVKKTFRMGPWPFFTGGCCASKLQPNLLEHHDGSHALFTASNVWGFEWGGGKMFVVMMHLVIDRPSQASIIFSSIYFVLFKILQGFLTRCTFNMITVDGEYMFSETWEPISLILFSYMPPAMTYISTTESNY